MAPPINVQDWYGDRHTCQIASGALAHISAVHAYLVLNKQRRRSAYTVDVDGLWHRLWRSGAYSHVRQRSACSDYSSSPSVRLSKGATTVLKLVGSESRRREPSRGAKGIILFLCLVYGLKFGNAKRFLYKIHTLIVCILSVRRPSQG